MITKLTLFQTPIKKHRKHNQIIFQKKEKKITIKKNLLK
jgi:hypothetical protein